MRIGFVTCVQLGLSCMQTLYEAGGHLDFALSLHDDRAANKSGRVYLDEFCRARSIPLAKIRNINDHDAIAAIRDASLDWLFIIGWSQIAGPEVLRSVRRAVLGMHPTLLPVGRGRAAIPWAILLNLAETGVTLFQLDSGIDTGPIAAQVRVSLGPRETASELYHKVDEAHCELMRGAWPLLAEDQLVLRAQDESSATVWAGRRPEDGRLDPSMTVGEADRLVRAVTRPYPGAFIDRDGRRLRVWEAHPLVKGLSAPIAEKLTFRDGELAVTCSEWELLHRQHPFAPG